jgi:phage shock protein E
MATFILGVVCAVAWNVFVWWRGWPSIKARTLVERGAVVLDVRSAQEFARGHVEGAIHVAPEAVAAMTVQIPYRSAPASAACWDQAVVVYAATRRRCDEAARSLRAAGFTRVWALGTLSRW